MNPRLKELLDDLREYMYDRADADAAGDPPRYIGNREMGFLQRIDHELECGT